MTMANSNRQTETANGSVQLPVRSRIQAKATGERMPATAPEAFISELEVPAESGAMSIVAAHSGGMAKPRKNAGKAQYAVELEEGGRNRRADPDRYRDRGHEASNDPRPVQRREPIGEI